MSSTGPVGQTIPTCGPSDSPEQMTDALSSAGCLVITDMATPAQCAQVREDLSAHMDSIPVDEDDPEAFYPGATRRITALVSRSVTVREFVSDPAINNLTERQLGDNCEHHQLHVTAALEVGPGARAQTLHREEDPFGFFPLPRPNMVIATMWAISDFTAANGGTLLVPGSHRWDGSRKHEPHEVVSAEMPAGSVLVWLGGTLHGAGANVTSDQWRYGVILSYSLGWLRQEENQYLDMPRDLVAELPQELKALTGHTMHGALGFHDPSVG